MGADALLHLDVLLVSEHSPTFAAAPAGQTLAAQLRPLSFHLAPPTLQLFASLALRLPSQLASIRPNPQLFDPTLHAPDMIDQTEALAATARAPSAVLPRRQSRSYPTPAGVPSGEIFSEQPKQRGAGRPAYSRREKDHTTAASVQAGQSLREVRRKPHRFIYMESVRCAIQVCLPCRTRAVPLCRAAASCRCAVPPYRHAPPLHRMCSASAAASRYCFTTGQATTGQLSLLMQLLASRFMGCSCTSCRASAPLWMP